MVLGFLRFPSWSTRCWKRKYRFLSEAPAPSPVGWPKRTWSHWTPPSWIPSSWPAWSPNRV